MIPLRQWLSAHPPAGFGAIEEIPAPPPTDRLRQDLDAAYERGRAEAGETNRILLQAALDRERAVHADVLAGARAQWCEKESGLLAAAIQTAMTTVHDELAAAAARVLGGFLEGEAEARAVAGFRDALVNLAKDHDMVLLEGAADLIAALGELPAGVRTQVSDKSGLRATADETRIESGLAQWAAALKGDEQ